MEDHVLNAPYNFPLLQLYSKINLVGPKNLNVYIRQGHPTPRLTGYFSLGFKLMYTPPIPYNADPETVQVALESLGNGTLVVGVSSADPLHEHENLIDGRTWRVTFFQPNEDVPLLRHNATLLFPKRVMSAEAKPRYLTADEDDAFVDIQPLRTGYGIPVLIRLNLFPTTHVNAIYCIKTTSTSKISGSFQIKMDIPNFGKVVTRDIQFNAVAF